jgi:LysR family nitrogen assimilation transcriptional regulator
MCLVGHRRLLARALAPRATTIDVEALAGIPLYLSHRAHVIRELIERCARGKGVTLNILAEVDSLYIMKALVVHGAGCGILSMANVHRELEQHDLRIVRIVKPAIRRDVCLVQRQGHVMPRGAREMARLAVQILLQMTRDDTWHATPLLDAGDIQTLF